MGKMLVVPAVLFLAVGGTIIGLWAAGGIDLAAMGLKRQPVDPHVGKTAVPLSAREIPAYTKITRDDLLNPQTFAPNYVYMDPEAAEQRNALTQLSDILGRVTANEKKPGYLFTEDDFLPEGARAGIVGGIPPGKRALTLDVSKINGAHGLQAGDHLDLIAAKAYDARRGGSLLSRSGRGGGPVIPAGGAVFSTQSEVRVLVQDGVVVQPVTTRMKPVSYASLTRGRTHRQIPVQEIVVAVAPREVAPLMQAMCAEAELQAVARSGHPDDPGEKQATPATSPRYMETIVGSERTVLTFPPGSAVPEIIHTSAESDAGQPDTAGPGS